MTLTGLTETLTAVKEQLMATFMNIYSALQKKANADEVYTKDEAKQLRRKLNAASTGPKVLQRGMISLNAMPGVVYRNLGYIRIPVKWGEVNEDGLRTGVIDANLQCLSRISGGSIELKVVYLGESQSAKEKEILDLLSYDPQTGRLTGTITHLCDAGSGLGHSRNLSVRVCIHTDAKYIYKNEDGAFVQYWGNVMDPTPPPPTINLTKATTEWSRQDRSNGNEFDLYSIIYAGVQDVPKLEIQILRRGERFRPCKGDRGPDWHYRASPRTYTRWVRLKKPLRGSVKGIVRIRVPRSNRRLASPWVKMIFDLSGNYNKTILKLKNRTYLRKDVDGN